MLKRLILLVSLLVFVSSVHAAARRRALTPMPPIPLDPCAPATLATNVTTFDIRIDDAFVYYGDDAGGLYRVTKGGGASQLIATFPDAVESIALDGDNIDLLTIDINGMLGALWVVPKSGGTPQQLLGGLLTPYAVTFDQSSIYWTSIGTPEGDTFLADGSVQRVGKDGKGRSILASNLNTPVSLAVDATNVYYAEAGLSNASNSAGLRSIPKNGGAVKSLVSGIVTALTLTDTNVIYGDVDVNAGVGRLQRIAKSGGTPTTLAGNLDLLLEVIISGDSVYAYDFAAGDAILAVPLAGGSPRVVISGEFETTQFAVDDCGVYVADGDGNLRRVAR